MKRVSCISIGKFEENTINEDAAIATDSVIAVSDGAGGGGLFAEKWSGYLLDNLPNEPITTFSALDSWIEGIWEEYYNSSEMEAKKMGGMSLDKFYDEGSFATLVAVWKSENNCRWCAFGDSVAFNYNYKTKMLERSFGKLADFDNPPYLINCKDELKEEGFHSGVFNTDDDSVVFVASDALAHYIMMMYEVSNKDVFEDEIHEALSVHSKNENYIKTAMGLKPIDFEKDVLEKLLKNIFHQTNIERHLKGLVSKGLLAHDDYSIAFF